MLTRRPRRAGQRLQREIRRRRSELIREYWRHLLLATLLWFTLFGTVAAGMWAMAGPLAGVFFLGFAAGSYVMLATATFGVIEPGGARLNAGLWGEQATAKELRKLRRAGWREIPNLHFRDGEVDHVAVGPGGVVVIETKASKADWSYLAQCGATNRWTEQASRGVPRVRALVRQESGHDVRPVAVVAVWAIGKPETPITTSAGVTMLGGDDLGPYLRALPSILDHNDVQLIAAELDDAARGFDRAVEASGRRHR